MCILDLFTVFNIFETNISTFRLLSLTCPFTLTQQKITMADSGFVSNIYLLRTKSENSSFWSYIWKNAGE
jgi:hypothetical protein